MSVITGTCFPLVNIDSWLKIQIFRNYYKDSDWDGFKVEPKNLGFNPAAVMAHACVPWTATREVLP